MEVKETRSIENPFEKIGKLWGIFSVVSLIIGVILLLMTKGDFQNFRTNMSSQDGQQIIPFGQFALKLFSGLMLLGMGIKYIRIALSAVFKFDPDKKLTENLAKEVQSNDKGYYAYNANSLFKILQSKNLELIKPTTLIENITARVFAGLKNIPPRYFIVSQNFLNAVVSSASPFLILLIALFLNYLEIINIFSGNRFEWLLFLISVSVVFSWSPFSPITEGAKRNKVAIILSLTSIGTLLIVRTTRIDYQLPEIPGSVFLVTLVFVILSAGIFYAFFSLLKRRVHIEGTNDSISVIKGDFDKNIHPDEIHRVISNRLLDLGDSNLVNRVYHDQYQSGQGKFKMVLMQETQPIPKYTIKDSVLISNANNLSKIGFAGATLGLLLFGILVSISDTFIGILLSTVTSFGIVNFGLKLIHLSNLFLSEFVFESKIVSVVGNGEYTSSQLTAGRGKNDAVESRNEVTKSSISLQFASTRILSVSFMQLGKADPFDNSPRYIVSLDKDDNSISYLINSFNEYLSEKSQIVGVNSKDAENIRNIRNAANAPVKNSIKEKEEEKDLLGDSMDDFKMDD